MQLTGFLFTSDQGNEGGELAGARSTCLGLVLPLIGQDRDSRPPHRSFSFIILSCSSAVNKETKKTAADDRTREGKAKVV